MKIHLIAMGTRMPQWVSSAYKTYTKRLPHHLQLILREIPLLKRSRTANHHTLLSREGEKMLAIMPKNCFPIALDEHGERWTSQQLATQMTQWQTEGQDIVLFIGSPEGLAPACRQQAKKCWSLSPLTLPHPLVRIVVAEQLYRAWTIIHQHPYHNN